MKSPTDNQRGHWPYIWTLAATALILWGGSVVLGVNRADGAEVLSQNRWQQPYGGCKEAWQAPHSAGADECRAHGWHISSRFVVGPRGVVRYNMLPACKNEDGSGQRGACYWWDGDLALINDSRDRAHYVWDTNPLWWWRNWHWSTAQDRAHYGMRYDCIVRDTVNAQGEAVARCPGRGW